MTYPIHKIGAFGLVIWDAIDTTPPEIMPDETGKQYNDRFNRWYAIHKESCRLFNYLTHRAYDTASCMSRLEFIEDHVN